MLRLTTYNEEYTFNTVEELVATANKVANGNFTSYDFEDTTDGLEFGFNTLGNLTVSQMEEWIKEERELLNM